MEKIEYISSEESDNENNCRKVRKLTWESTKLKEYKQNLDQIYMAECCSTSQLAAFKNLVRGSEVSDRPLPRDAPSWAVSEELD